MLLQVKIGKDLSKGTWRWMAVLGSFSIATVTCSCLLSSTAVLWLPWWLCWWCYHGYCHGLSAAVVFQEQLDHFPRGRDHSNGHQPAPMLKAL